MTEADLTRIEAELEVRLPGEYRNLMVPFPIPAFAGNVDTELWDDAEKLIELNRELRAGNGLTRPWPEYLFALGRDGSGCANAIDLRDAASPIWWADRCHLDPNSGQNAPLLADWVKQYLEEAHVFLEERGLAPSASPEARARAEEQSARAGCRAVLVVLGVAVLIVFGLFIAFKLIG